MDSLGLTRSTAGTAGVEPNPAVAESTISSALRQLRQVQQGYIDSWNRPSVTRDSGKHIKGFAQGPADPAGLAVSEQHQWVEDGSALKTPCRSAVLRRQPARRPVSLPDQHLSLLPAEVTILLPQAVEH
jgi:hypothetical protein